MSMKVLIKMLCRKIDNEGIHSWLKEILFKLADEMKKTKEV